ncbi:MAG: hypothetical protein R3281_01635 [Balneolaceae bacterium]|nr:hypothetical protein [Balneolaceae bacterium]
MTVIHTVTTGMEYHHLFILIFTLILLLFGCTGEKEKPGPMMKEAVVLNEHFQTARDEDDNVDSPAVWHGPDGEHWLLATAN